MSTKPEIQFDAALHQYAVDNELVPCHVTGILEAYGIIDFSQVPAFTLQRKQLLGDLVHQITAYIDQDGLTVDLAAGLVLDDEAEQCLAYDIDLDDVLPYSLAWTRFIKETGFVQRLIEHRWVPTVNGMRYGMTIDRAGVLAKRETILDIKCTHAREKSWPVQLAGYRLGLPLPERCARYETANVWLKPDGTYSLCPGGRTKTDPTIERRDEEVFLAALRLAHWKLENLGHV